MVFQNWSKFKFSLFKIGQHENQGNVENLNSMKIKIWGFFWIWGTVQKWNIIPAHFGYTNFQKYVLFLTFLIWNTYREIVAKLEFAKIKVWLYVVVKARRIWKSLKYFSLFDSKLFTCEFFKFNYSIKENYERIYVRMGNTSCLHSETAVRLLRLELPTLWNSWTFRK